MKQIAPGKKLFQQILIIKFDVAFLKTFLMLIFLHGQDFSLANVAQNVKKKTKTKVNILVQQITKKL